MILNIAVDTERIEELNKAIATLRGFLPKEPREPSPLVVAFVQEYCDQHGLTSTATIYEAWCRFCEKNGCEPGDNANFGSKLSIVVPHVQRIRRKINGTKIWCYEGLSLK